MDLPPVILPIQLQPSNLRPLAYRILSKKHGLNIKTDALKVLSDHIGPKFGDQWKSAKAQLFIEEVAKVWKEQERGLFLDAEGITEVLKELEALESKSLRANSTIETNNHGAGNQKSVDAFLKPTKNDIAEKQDTIIDADIASDDEMGVSRTSPATSVTPPPMRETIDWREYFKLVNAFEQPIFDYNYTRKQYELSKIQNSKFDSASIESNILLAQKRYHITKDRLLRNENFQSNPFNALSSIQVNSTVNTITMIKNLLGRNNQRFLLFGMLTLLNGEYFLQDTSDKIQLNIFQTEPTPGTFYTPGNMVICDGIYSSGIFYCSSMAHPPAERRQETLEAIGNVDFLGVHGNLRIDRDLQVRLKLLEREYDHKVIILGSDCFLDDLKVLDGLNKLFFKLAEDEHDLPVSIIFNGSFASSPKHSSEYKSLFDSLAEVLEKHPVIAANISLVFIPGDNDQWQTPIWPKQRIPKLFGNRLNRIARGVQWASNPTRMVYLSQELVIARDDIGSRLRRNTVIFPALEKEATVDVEAADGEHGDMKPSTQIDKIESLPPRVSEARKIVKTILDQGHLTPFPKTLKPVAWHLDHTLHLSPLPNVLILSDPTSPSFDVTYNGCRCLNPGVLLQRRKLNYIEYTLASKTAEIKELYF